MSVDTQVRELGRTWATAELAGDADTLDTLLADDFLAVGPRGYVLTKTQWTDRYRSGDLVHNTFSWDEVGIRDYGDAVVAVGVQDQDSAHQGHPAGGRFRVTQTLVRRDGAWRIAALHLSPIVPPPGSLQGQ